MKTNLNYFSFIRSVFIVIFFTGVICLHSFAGNYGDELFKPEILKGTIVSGTQDSVPSPVEFISCYFENASPLYWEYNPDGSVNVQILYDHERSTPNRASNHWHFQVQAKPGSDVTVYINYFDELWNSQIVRQNDRIKNVYISENGEKWSSVPAEPINHNSHKVMLTMKSGSIYVAGVEPYRLSDLDKLISEIKPNSLVEISYIGKTVEGRPLEIIRVGNPDAPNSVFLRARAHAWEAGGNWVVQGLIKSLLDKEENKKYLEKYCVYIMPMANKDGVARGMTRFNVNGMDLNRNWDALADPILSPENYALETWLQKIIGKGKKPDLAIDMHNDRGGTLLISHPKVNLEQYLANMEKFSSLLKEYSWFREGVTHGFAYGIGTGLVERYGIDGCVYELNQVWIRGLNKIPFGEDWELLGKQLRDVFYHYFDKP